MDNATRSGFLDPATGESLLVRAQVLLASLGSRVHVSLSPTSAAVVLFSLPTVSAVLLRDFEQSISWLWLVWVWGTCVVTATFARVGWNFTMAKASLVRGMLADVSAEQSTYLDRSYRLMAHPITQTAFMAGGATAVVLVAITYPKDVMERVAPSILSLIAAGAVAGHTIHLVAGFTLCSLWVSRIRPLKLSATNPLETPGLRHMSRVIQLGVKLGMLIYAVVAVPITWLYLQEKTVQGRLTYISLMLVPIVCLSLLAIVAQTLLASAAQEKRDEVLKEVGQRAEKAYEKWTSSSSAAGSSDALQAYSTLLELHSEIASQPTSYLRGEVVAQYLTATAVAVAPFAIAFLIA